MKTIIAAATLATLIASPVFAQSYDPSVGSGNVARQVQAPTLQMKLQGAQGAYAQAGNGGAAIVQFSGNGTSDPGANIRFQLNREAVEGRW